MKKGFGFFVTILAAVLAGAAGVFFLAIHGTFGLDSTHNGVCYDPMIVALLLGGAIAALVLAAVKYYGVASAVITAAPGVAICVFVHKCYWYVVDVFVGIDEKHGFDPRFITFSVLLVLAFLVGELALYAKKTRQA